MTALAMVVALVLLLWTGLLFVPFRWRPVGLYLFVPKLAASALSPFIAVFAASVAVFGAILGSWWIAVIAGLASVGAVVVVLRVGAVRPDLTAAFGPNWAQRISDESRARMVGRWWRGRLPSTPEPRLRQDVVFWTIPGTDRPLRCDLWEPAPEVAPSGVAIVYLHGSAWYILDKDALTRPLFRQLTGQGHVVMDVAYRLFPETDIPGMVADAKRAVAWLKAQANDLGVRPDRIVLSGGSAGGHLALLAAYAHEDPALTPPELIGADPTVFAVVSLYGQADLAAMYEHTGQRSRCSRDDPRPDWDAPPPAWALRLFGADASRLALHRMMVAGRCDWLLGGTPDEVPQRYIQLSPLHRVHPGCPPTLLVHGQHDSMAPVASTRQLHQRLEEAGVPTTAVFLPHTDHGFDLPWTVWSPPARAGIHALERFLAAVATATVPLDARRVEGTHDK